MATNHTEHYELSQWLSTDQVVRTDFNADNAKTDAALADLEANKADLTDLTALTQRVAALEALPHVVTGTYTGDGTASRFISLGFTPKALLVFRQEGYPADAYTDNLYGGMALPDTPVRVLVSPNYYVPVLSIAEGGFQVYYDSSDDVRSNQEDTVYHYMAWK